jgi:putative flippase GtrA
MPTESGTPLNRRLGDLLRLQIVRFLVVGVANTAFSYLVYALLLFVGLNYALANLGALILGILFSFRTQGRFVFNNTNSKLLGRFVIAWAVVYALTIVIIGRLISFGLDAYTAGAFALPITALASFFVQKYFVFRSSARTTERLEPDILE